MTAEKFIQWYAIGITALTFCALMGLLYLWSMTVAFRSGNLLPVAADSRQPALSQLNGQIDSLMSDYHQLALENAMLRGDVPTAEALLKGKNSELSLIRTRSGVKPAALREEIFLLKHFKNELEASLVALQHENSALRAESVRLSRALAGS